MVADLVEGVPTDQGGQPVDLIFVRSEFELVVVGIPYVFVLVFDAHLLRFVHFCFSAVCFCRYALWIREQRRTYSHNVRVYPKCHGIPNVSEYLAATCTSREDSFTEGSAGF